MDWDIRGGGTARCPVVVSLSTHVPNVVNRRPAVARELWHGVRLSMPQRVKPLIPLTG